MHINYTSCPICDSEDIIKNLDVTDHSVSKLSFEVWLCNKCTLQFTQNVPDESELGAFYKSENYISHTDTKKGWINSMYHFIRKRTLNSKKNLIKKETKLSTGKILDIGAGTGAFLNVMQKSKWVIEGVEPDETARKLAESLYNVKLKTPDGFFDYPEESFDAITLWHVLEHVHDLHLYMENLKKLLKNNGRLFIAVPNYTSYDAEVYKQYWAAYDVPRHLYHFSPVSMMQLLLKHGFQLKKIKPMWYDSYYVSMLSEQYKTGKNNFLGAVWTGFQSNWKALFDNEKCSSVIYVITR